MASCITLSAPSSHRFHSALVRGSLRTALLRKYPSTSSSKLFATVVVCFGSTFLKARLNAESRSRSSRIRERIASTCPSLCDMRYPSCYPHKPHRGRVSMAPHSTGEVGGWMADRRGVFWPDRWQGGRGPLARLGNRYHC